MNKLGVTEWRSQLGQLRQSTEPVIVLYRRQPAALMVPIPPMHWDDAGPFIDQILAIRDQYLAPPHLQEPHPWAQAASDTIKFGIEDARRGSARLFGIVMRNTPVTLTFYNYDGALMLPLPPGLPDTILESIIACVEEHL